VCCLPTIKNWWFCICSILLGSSRIANIDTFVSNLLHCIIPFLISSLCISEKGRYIMFGGTFFKQWTQTITLKIGSFLRGKQFENSFPNVSSTNRHSAASNPFSSSLTTSFVKNFSFFCTLAFSFCDFFCSAQPTWALKVSHSSFKGLLGVYCQFVLLNLKNLSQQSWTSCVVLSFNSLNLKPFSALVRESSSLILSIEQTRSITYFFLGSLSMRMTVTRLWTQTFNACMGIIFTNSSLSFLMKWNSIKDSYVSISLSSQADTFFKRVQVPSSTSR